MFDVIFMSMWLCKTTYFLDLYLSLNTQPPPPPPPPPNEYILDFLV